MARYSVRYLDSDAHPLGYDAVASRLRVLRDDEYFCFITPMVTGPEILGHGGITGPEWWAALAVVGAREFELRLSDPALGLLVGSTAAVIVPVAMAQVSALVASGEPLPKVTSDPFGQVEVYGFEGD